MSKKNPIFSGKKLADLLKAKVKWSTREIFSSEKFGYLHAARVTWDRCYDFKNIFAKKIGEKIDVLDSKQSYIMQKCDHNIGFWEKRQIFRRK
jgi:hypothetical protein